MDEFECDVDVLSILSDQNDKRILLKRQDNCDIIKNEMCNKIKELKQNIIIPTELQKYVHKLETFESGIWCFKCSTEKRIHIEDIYVDKKPVTEQDTEIVAMQLGKTLCDKPREVINLHPQTITKYISKLEIYNSWIWCPLCYIKIDKIDEPSSKIDYNFKVNAVVKFDENINILTKNILQDSFLIMTSIKKDADPSKLMNTLDVSIKKLISLKEEMFNILNSF